METVRASFTWSGPDVDVLRLFVEPTPTPWSADPIDDDIVVLYALDACGQETGRVAGIEIVGLLSFDRWNALPDLPILWELTGETPRPLAALLERLQRELQPARVPGSASPILTPAAPRSHD